MIFEIQVATAGEHRSACTGTMSRVVVVLAIILIPLILLMACTDEATPVRLTSTPIQPAVTTPPMVPTSTSNTIPKSTPIPQSQGWDIPFNVSNSPRLQSDSTRLLVSTSGLLVHTWIELDLEDGPKPQPVLAYRIEGNWSAAIPVPLPGEWRGVGYQVALDASETFHWAAAFAPTPSEFSYQVWYTQIPMGGEWTRPKLIFTNPDKGDSGVSSIAFDSTGTMHMVLYAASGSKSRSPVWYLTRSPEGTWSEPLRLSFIPNALPFHTPSRLAIGLDDTLHLVWINIEYSISMYTNKTRSGGWQEPIDITPTIGIGGAYNLIIDSQDNLHFLWLHSQSFSQELYYAVKPNGQDMTAPVNLSKTPGDYESTAYQSSRFSLAIDEEGRLHAIWQEVMPNWEKGSREAAIRLTADETDDLFGEDVPELRRLTNEYVYKAPLLPNTTEARYVTKNPDTGEWSDPQRIPLNLDPLSYPWLLCAEGAPEVPSSVKAISSVILAGVLHVMVQSGCVTREDIFYITKPVR